VAARAETVTSGPRCTRGAPIRSYDIDAINVDITLNRYLDHDPEGRMYVLSEDVERVRSEEKQNANARKGKGEPAVSLGLQGDAIQPLTLRVAQGECLRVRLRNALRDEPVSVHLHGSSLSVGGSNSAAIASNASAMALPGRRVSYEWMTGTDTQEGTYTFHSHGRDRIQTGHGLFGAVVVEPAGSRWIDPLTGREARSGWAAVIRDPGGPDFREFAIYYHEIADESYQILDHDDRLVPLVDPLTKAYRPGTRALNYRAEPFMNRLELQQELQGRFDESVSYSSYTFGDPATPILRSYLGDPVKQRIVHGGSEVFHVHHVHGGSIRWRRQPKTEDTGFNQGLLKHPSLLPRASERIDAQGIGPSETFDVENECGTGGCQQSAGDYLLHCHVAHHYFAGMWGIWRAYNTKQDGKTSTDSLPPLIELPDRRGDVRSAVASDALRGKRVDWSGKRREVGDLANWVEPQLPPRGRPRGYDASVLDWRRDGDVYLGEPDARRPWPGYRARAPGQRPPLLFDPRTGKLAYPFLRPHLGKRPPFAPNHGPAPFLDPTPVGADPPSPGANGPSSLCPEGTRVKTFFMRAITLPIALNERTRLLDPGGQIYVLQEEEEAVRADNKRRVPLAIRANAGEDCVDVVLTSELEDNEENHGFSKVNSHIHFVQFDVQASDGVITGFNYEQSVRPYTKEGTPLGSAASAGATSIAVAGTQRFPPGAMVGIGMDRTEPFEIRRVVSATNDELVLDRPLERAHRTGEIVSTEFVRYRWYPDVQFGTAYFHDHVNAIASWRHGLFGALISEPPGSTYHDPESGAELASGPKADIHTDARVSADVTGSFRELALFVQDDNPLTAIRRSSGSAFNMRAEPLDERGDDPSRALSSRELGDPETPMLEAFVGDPMVFRLLVGATNDVHTWHLDGHWFRTEPYSKTSQPTGTVHVGISERYDLSVPAAGGPARFPGDYLYANGRSFKLEEGSWGIVRVLGADETSALRTLPGRERAEAGPRAVCPGDARERTFSIAAINAALPMLDGGVGKLYVIESLADAVASGKRKPVPLVLHVNVGDCVRIRLSNRTDAPVSLHADMLAADPNNNGTAVGRNDGTVVAPGKTHGYTFYAHPDVGETVALVTDRADPVRNPRMGLYGAIIVGPRGTKYLDSVSGRDVSAQSGWNVIGESSGGSWRDFTLFLQDEDPSIGTHRMPYSPRVQGAVGINYRAAPIRDRLEDDTEGRVFDPAIHGEPPTPVMAAFAGDPVRIHVLAPSSEQAHVFTLEGHEWPFERGREGTDFLSSVQLGGLEAITIAPEGGAGGRFQLPGTYLYGDHREPYREAGLWGIFKVRCPGFALGVRPLRGPATDIGACTERASFTSGRNLTLVLVLGLLAVMFVRRRLRSAA
jgi:FtsP/CotA-like multicopper oxidase with cupredoxin domain